MTLNISDLDGTLLNSKAELSGKSPISGSAFNSIWLRKRWTTR